MDSEVSHIGFKSWLYHFISMCFNFICKMGIIIWLGFFFFLRIKLLNVCKSLQIVLAHTVKNLSAIQETWVLSLG